jgi:hypothetical protein
MFTIKQPQQTTRTIFQRNISSSLLHNVFFRDTPKDIWSLGQLGRRQEIATKDTRSLGQLGRRQEIATKEIVTKEIRSLGQLGRRQEIATKEKQSRVDRRRAEAPQKKLSTRKQL